MEKTIQRIRNKKGQMIGPLNMIQAVMIFLLVLGVISIALFVGVTTLSTENIIARKTTDGITFANVSLVLREGPNGNETSNTQGLIDVTLRNIVVTNSTNSAATIINTGNFSVSNGVFTATATSTFTNETLNFSAAFTHTVDSDAVQVSRNITFGTTNFFSNIPTIFNILGAVIIITAVVLILFAVNRIQGASSSIQ